MTPFTWMLNWMSTLALLTPAGQHTESPALSTAIHTALTKTMVSLSTVTCYHNVRLLTALEGQSVMSLTMEK